MPHKVTETGVSAVSEPQPSQSASNTQTVIFMVILSFVCALILSILASVLEKPKEIAKDLDRSKQLMIAAKILDHGGYFLIQESDGEYIPAKSTSDGILVPGTMSDIASNAELLKVYSKRVIPLLVDDQGDTKTFADLKINEEEYIAKYKKTGYYKEPQKLIYAILPNSKEEKPIGYVIPVNGYGLWDAIYGYLAVKPNGRYYYWHFLV